MITLSGKVVLITGASRGIGAACVRLFARAGADVVLNYRNSQREAQELLHCLPDGGKHLLVPSDVSSAEEVEVLFRAIDAAYGRLDILVANAGIWEGQAIENLTEAAWDRTMRINLKSVFLCCRQATLRMKKQGNGNIITISSTAGQRGEANHSDYAASKGAIISFTKSLASELGPHGIRVNCVAPGWVDTEMSAVALREDPAGRRAIESAIPLRRIATAEEIAGPVLFLASDLAGHVHGEILNVNGGSVLCG
jgi:3-oxoacyl-[acyl-carrier protein] reductase